MSGGRELGAVTPRDAGNDHRGRGGELAVRVDDHDRLQAGAAGAAALPAHLAIAGHGRRLVPSPGFRSCRVRRAGSRAGRRSPSASAARQAPDRGEQVRPVQPHGLEFRPYPSEVGEHGGHVGERGVHQPEDARQCRRDGGESGDDVSRDVVAGGDLAGRCRRSSGLSVLFGDGLGEPFGGQPRELRGQVDSGEPPAELDRG